MKFLAAAALSLALATPAFSQALDSASLTWLAGSRVHTNADGSKVYEAFIGPLNGVMTGTALSARGLDQPYTEYHKLGPNADGKWGLSVASSRNNMASWSFTPLKTIQKDRVVFQSDDGNLTVTYFAKSGGGVGSRVERIANGKTTVTEYDFKPAVAVAEPGAEANDPLSFFKKGTVTKAPGKLKPKGY